jgi:formylglycine-generating enzyme required for sulfatase activity
VIQPENSLLGAADTAAAQNLLVSAALQQSLSNQSEYWAPVYELGSDGKSAFYVTKLYARSAQRLIDSKTKLTSADLLNITSAIVEGLSDLRSAYQRSHGNLKPGNVLIDDKGRRANIVLADPAVNGDPGPSINKPPDTKALGEIIYALVTFRPHTSARWPVQPSDEWARLGSTGPQWLTLCNDLLNTMARGGPPTLEQLKDRLEKMRPTRRRFPRKIIAAAALIALACAGYIYRAPIQQQATKQYAALRRTWAKSNQQPAKHRAVKKAATSKPVDAVNKPAIAAAHAKAIVPPPTTMASPIAPPVAPLVVPPSPVVASKPPPRAWVDPMIEQKRAARAAHLEQALHDGAAAEDAIHTGRAIEQAKVIQQADTELIAVMTDEESRQAAKPLADKLDAIRPVWTASREQLISLANSPTNSPVVRLAASQRLDIADTKAWPVNEEELAQDRSILHPLRAALVQAGNSPAVASLDKTAAARLQTFFAALTTSAAITDALHWQADHADLLPVDQCPAWFQYDLALQQLKNEPQPDDGELKNLQSLAESLKGNADVDELQRALTAAIHAPPNPAALDQSGPASADWTLRGPGDSQGRWCIYLSPSNPSASRRAIEFIRVDPGEHSAISPFYLSTTEVPIALVQELVDSNPNALQAIKELNGSTEDSGARVWSFLPSNGGIGLDEQDYKRYFRVAPSDDLPMQQVTPQMALYVARYLGCRLPTSAEWQAALKQAMASSDSAARGFASLGWKLRDSYFQRLFNDPRRGPGILPDDDVFLGPDPTNIAHHGTDPDTWQPADVEKLGGETIADTPASKITSELEVLMADAGAGFRPVGTYRHVFHDLIGNVAEFVMDEPGHESEQLKVSHDPSGQKTIAGWFAADHRLGEVAVIGGSALSPPQLDPRSPTKLPADTKHLAFADVGFRLAFTDPHFAATPLQSALRSARYVTAKVAQ